jgi:hypothetical protein
MTSRVEQSQGYPSRAEYIFFGVSWLNGARISCACAASLNVGPWTDSHKGVDAYAAHFRMSHRRTTPTPRTNEVRTSVVVAPDLRLPAKVGRNVDTRT